MTLSTLALITSCVALEMALLAGLIRRRRLSQSYLLLPLVISWASASLAFVLHPVARTWDFWLVKELVHAALAVALGIELALRVFRPLPTPWLWARLVLASVPAVAGVLVASHAPGPFSVRVMPSLLMALAWLYTGLGCLLLHYRMPVERLHRALLWGLPPYLVLYAATWGQAASDAGIPNSLNPPMFTAVLCVLTWVAWQPDDPAPEADPGTVFWLWPWRLGRIDRPCR